MDSLYVMGAGGIGLLLQLLISKNDRCTLIGRESTKTCFKDSRLIVEGALEESIDVDCVTVSDLDQVNENSIIFLATKAQDLKPALTELAPSLREDSLVVLCQNGIGIFEEAQTEFPHLKFLRLHCWMGVQRVEINKIRFAGAFKFDLAAKQSEAKNAQEDLLRVASYLERTAINLDCGWNPELSEWKKALWNIAVNGLLSIVDARNGAILDYPELKSIARGLLEEAQSVAVNSGIPIEPDDLEQVFKSLEKTRNNFNATLQDLRHGKHPEIEYLNGAVVKRAKEHDQIAPLNETIVNLISYLEKVEARREIVK